LPPTCSGCRRPGSLLCGACRAAVEPWPPTCPACDRPSSGGATHPACRIRSPLAGQTVAGVYGGPLTGAIRAFKYRHRRALARPLAELLAAGPLALAPRPELVVPVPLHPGRERSWAAFSGSGTSPEPCSGSGPRPPRSASRPPPGGKMSGGIPVPPAGAGPGAKPLAGGRRYHHRRHRGRGRPGPAAGRCPAGVGGGRRPRVGTFVRVRAPPGGRLKALKYISSFAR